MLRRAVEDGLGRTTRQPTIEGFRGVVVIAVVGYHLLRLLLTLHGGNWGSQTSPWWWWMGIARFGVDAFFVLAGAFVTSSWLSGRRRSPSRTAAVADFAHRRALRILPPFLGVVVLLGVPALIAGRISLGEFALFLTTQQHLVQGLAGSIALPLWSLTAEVQFYVVAPVLAVFVRRTRLLPYVLVGLTLLTSMSWTAWSGREPVPAGVLPGRLDQFVVGAVIGTVAARVRHGERSRLAGAVLRPGAAVVLFGSLLALGIYHGATFESSEAHHVLAYAVHPLAGVLLGLLILRMLIGPSIPALGITPWRFLGLISYSLYLWHYPILDWGIEWFGLRADGPASPTRVVLVSVFLVAVAVAVATVSYVLLEHPFIRRRGPREVVVAGPVAEQREPVYAR